MENLRKYLNSLSLPEQVRFALSCGTSIGYLRKAISKRPKMDGALCCRLDEKSNGAIPRESLRPDIWPELVIHTQDTTTATET